MKPESIQPARHDHWQPLRPKCKAHAAVAVLSLLTACSASDIWSEPPPDAGSVVRRDASGDVTPDRDAQPEAETGVPDVGADRPMGVPDVVVADVVAEQPRDGGEDVVDADVGVAQPSDGGRDVVDTGPVDADADAVAVDATDGNDVPDVTVCGAACLVEGELRCTGRSIEMCTMRNGCATWVHLASCTTDQLCCGGVCVEPDEANCFACGLACTGSTPSCSRTEQRCVCSSATCDGGIPDASVDASPDGDSGATSCPQSVCPGSGCASENCPYAFCLADCAIKWRDCSVSTWSSGEVVYKPIADAALAAKFRAAASAWEDASGGMVRFTRDTGDARSDALRVYADAPDGTGECTIGYSYSSAAVCHWSPTMSDAVAVHTLGHVLGLFHQELRADRDTYVQIMPDSFACSLDSRDFEDHWWKCSAGDDGMNAGSGFGEYSTVSVMQTPSTSRMVVKHRSDCQKDVVDAGTFPMAKDWSDVRELYAWPVYSWQKFISMSPLFGTDQPRRVTISSPPAPDVRVFGAPALAAFGDQLDAYVRGTDRLLYHRNMNSDGVWPDVYESLGGPWDSDPAAGTWGSDTRLVVAVRSSNVEVRVFAEGAWQQWLPNTVPVPNGLAPGSSPAVTALVPGVLQVAVFDSNHQVQLTRFKAAAPYTNGAWSGVWSAIPTGLPAGVQLSASPAITQASTGLDVVVVATNRHVYHTWANLNDIDNPVWNGFWETIGADADPSFRPTNTSRGWGRMDAFYRGDDGQLWWTYWNHYGSGWSGHRTLGGMLLSSPATTSTVGWSIIDVIGVGTDGGLWHRWGWPP